MASPSIVVISLPWQAMARVRQELTSLPSTITLQAPQTPMLQIHLRTTPAAVIAGADDGSSAFDNLGLTPLSTIKQALYAIEGIINNLPHEIEHYSITGGEPTMRKDLTQILLFLKRKKRSSVCLMTNGSCPERLKELLSAGLVAAVQLSLDGPREVHNAIRNSSKSYDLFMESLNELKQHRNVYAYILTVICKENLKHLAEITRFCSGQGITNLTFEFEKKYDKGCIADSIRELEPLMHLTREDFFISESASAFPEFSIRELKDALISAEHESKKVYFQNQYLPYSLFKNLEHYYLRNLRKSYKLQCRHLLTARIDPLGNVIACFGVRKPFGNLLREPLEKIWNNEDFRRYRKFILGNNLLPICETCHRAESFDTGFGRIS